MSRTVKFHCNVCLQETKHEVLFEYKDDRGGVVQGIPYANHTLWEFIRCRGCESIGIVSTWFPPTGPPQTSSYPPQVSRRFPDWLNDQTWHIAGSKKELRALFIEVYKTLHADSLRLALMGSRTIVDVALTDKLGDVGGFDRKLAEAVKNGWLSQAHRDILHKAVEAGNAAAHRAYRPEPSQMNNVLDIVEHLIQLLYSLVDSAETIAKDTPGRAKESR